MISLAGKEIRRLNGKGCEELINGLDKPPSTGEWIALPDQLHPFLLEVAEICTWLEMVYIMGSHIT